MVINNHILFYKLIYYYLYKIKYSNNKNNLLFDFIISISFLLGNIAI